ncbi:MAG: hypothetical protein OEW70_00425 [candidate division WOR-3 bacterium]|nr:hypothetical protein [candidate division WOR-3 bacterium]
MNLKKLGISVLLIIFLLGSSSLARTASKLAPSARVHDKEWLEVNRWRCPFYNDGRFGIDVGTRRDVAGGSWPYPLTNHYIFGAGIWVGALKPRADEPGRLDTLVSFGYNPNSGASELVPSLTRYYEAGYGGAWDRVYKYPGSWDIDRSEFKERFVADSLDTVLGLVPTTFFSAGDMWMCFSDADPEWHLEPGKPLGVDIFLQVYAWNYPSNRDIFFLLYKVKNVSEDTLKDMVLGVVMDADIGLPTDDMVGLIKDKLFGSGADTFRVRGVGYNYDNDGRESGSDWESGTPGAIAYKFLESPRAGPGDTMRLGMTAFKMFTIEIDPVKDPDQYLTLAGYDYRTRIKTPYDSIDLEPKDKRFIQCSGTFVLPPDSVTNIIVAVIAAEYPGSGGSPPTVWDTLPLAKVAAEAQFIYDQGWLLPEPPPNPTVRLIPSDHKVTITWNNLSELVPDKFYPVAQTTDTTSPSYNPNYKEYDFEGYKIYRSDDGGVNWLLLAQCDVVNGIQFEDSLTAESLRSIANDTGLFYTYVDEKVANGFTYYYAVNAFDYNFLRFRDTADVVTYEPFSLESGLKYTGVVPRSEPINLAPPAQLEAKLVGDTSLKIGVKISAEIVEPSLITGKKYQIRFLDPNPEYITWLEAYLAYTNPNKYRDTVRTAVLPSYRYYVIRDPDGECDTVLENSGYIYNILSAKTRLNGAPVFDGLKLTHEISMKRPSKFIDTVIVISGNYPAESLKVELSPYPIWPYRGGDFRIVWQGRSPDSLTPEITDITTNTQIFFSGYRYWASESDSVVNMKRANCWNFSHRPTPTTPPSPILREDDSYLYICGQPIYLRRRILSGVGTLRDLIQPGDIWMAYGPKGYARAPSGYWYELDTKDAELKFREDTTYKLNVIVTPNPYIVTNRWEQNRYERQIAFTRLPNECKIRIFTLAGDLIRVIEHKESSERRDEPTHPVTNDLGGTEVWNLLNRSEALVASGIYIFHVESKVGNQIGKFAVIH